MPELPAWPKRRKKPSKNALPLRSWMAAASTLSSAILASSSSLLSASPSTTSTRPSKTGDSFRLRRSQTANSMISAEPMNGIRQPHSTTVSVDMVATRMPQIAEAPRVPELVPSATSEPTRPRLFRGAYSVSITDEPAISAPAPKPWASRSSTSRIGASTPTWW